MNPIIQLVIGVILIVLALAALIPGIDTITGIDWLGNLIIVITGCLPAFLIFVGLIIAWLGFDEMKG